MYTGLQHLHSYWAYIALLLLLVAGVNAVIGLVGKKAFTERDRKISFFAMLATHIQLVIGLVLLFVSSYWKLGMEAGMGEVMKNPTLRLYLVEHPLTNILAIVLITVGWSRHKKKSVDDAKFKSIGVFYLFGLILLLSRIPWQAWMS